MRVVLLIGLLVGSAVADTAELNGYVDQFLNGVRNKLIEYGNAIVNIPDVNYNFEKKISFITVNGELRCSDGYISSLNSFKRSSDAAVTITENYITVSVGLRFDDLEFGYGTCEVKSNFIPTTKTRVKMTVGTIAVNLRFTFHEYEKDCDIYVEDVYLTNLDGIKIQTGTRLINRVVDKVLNWVARRFRKDAMNLINRNIKDLLGRPVGLCDKSLGFLKYLQNNPTE
ncbi:uncharacterized protein LOC106673958 [Cimex lectularius]|uniref:Uncharacterized protein n=1 Tax=Cimex lectularius TaxID=79782 RepID=A0A8I6SCM2_CIMLE|nr:uncharacterized protein LOC106673958 [Cimex lectularius]